MTATFKFSESKNTYTERPRNYEKIFINVKLDGRHVVCGWVCIPEISHFKNGENVEVYEKMFKIHTTEDGKGILKTI